MENKDKIILHLCASEFGSDSKPYRDAGYTMIAVDEKMDVRTFNPPPNVYGIIANPPCTMFSKARTKAKTPRDMMQGLELVEACLKIIWKCQARITRDANPEMPLKFWMLENPDGYLKWFLGKPAFVYQPFEFGDNYSKKTNIWGIFNEPIKPFFNNQISKNRSMSDLISPMTHRDPKERMAVRSIASEYFTKAFFNANP